MAWQPIQRQAKHKGRDARTRALHGGGFEETANGLQTERAIDILSVTCEASDTQAAVSYLFVGLFEIVAADGQLLLESEAITRSHRALPWSPAWVWMGSHFLPSAAR